MPQYPQSTWDELKFRYRSGMYTSLEEMHKKCTKLLKMKIPSLSALRKRAHKDNWDKKELQKELEEATHEKYMRLFREAGMDEKKIVETVLTLLNSHRGTDVDRGIVRMMELAGQKAPTKIEGNIDQKQSGAVYLIPRNGFEPKN